MVANDVAMLRVGDARAAFEGKGGVRGQRATPPISPACVSSDLYWVCSAPLSLGLRCSFSFVCGSSAIHGVVPYVLSVAHERLVNSSNKERRRLSLFAVQAKAQAKPSFGGRTCLACSLVCLYTYIHDETTSKRRHSSTTTCDLIPADPVYNNNFGRVYHLALPNTP